MSNKMFLIAKHMEVMRNPHKPAEGKMTNESFRVTKNLKKSDYAEASIIIDVAHEKIIKNRFTERSFDELFAYFMTHYKEQINQWVNAQKNS